MISVLVYLLRFGLLLGVEVALFYWVSRNTCRPLTGLNTEETFGGAIPPEATCYTRDHGTIAFHDFRPLSDDPIPAILTIGFVLCFFGLFFWRGFWIGGRKASGADPAASPAGSSSTGRGETNVDPFAASKAKTLRELVAVFRHRFGLGPFVLAGALVAFTLLTAAPALRQYAGYIFIAVPPAGGALLLGKSGTPTALARRRK